MVHVRPRYCSTRAVPFSFYNSTPLLTCATRPYTLLCTFLARETLKRGTPRGRSHVGGTSLSVHALLVSMRNCIGTGLQGRTFASEDNLVRGRDALPRAFNAGTMSLWRRVDECGLNVDVDGCVMMVDVQLAARSRKQSARWRSYF